MRSYIKALKINQEIKSDTVMLIDDEGVQQGTVSLDQALYLAYEKGLDLALINENSNPPICKILDYGKFLYNQEKQVSKQKARTHNQEIKEIRLGIKIGEHDLQVKINQAKKFLERGDKVKISTQLKGREMMFRNRVPELFEKVRKETGSTFEKPLEKMYNRFFATIVKGKSSETKNS